MKRFESTLASFAHIFFLFVAFNLCMYMNIYMYMYMYVMYYGGLTVRIRFFVYMQLECGFT